MEDKKNRKLFCTGLAVAFFIAMLDQFTKHYVFGLLNDAPNKEIAVTPYLRLVMVRNHGVSFGMLNDIPHGQLILSWLSLCIVMALVFWMWKVQRPYMIIALGLIIGGAVGNIIDRIMYGSVADFLDFYIKTNHWPAFNLADAAVFCGVVRLVIEAYEKDDRHLVLHIEDKKVTIDKKLLMDKMEREKKL